MNLRAFGDKNDYILCRHCKNKKEVKMQLLNAGLLVKVCYIIYKGKKYDIKSIYKW